MPDRKWASLFVRLFEGAVSQLDPTIFFSIADYQLIFGDGLLLFVRLFEGGVSQLDPTMPMCWRSASSQQQRIKQLFLYLKMNQDIIFMLYD